MLADKIILFDVGNVLTNHVTEGFLHLLLQHSPKSAINGKMKNQINNILNDSFVGKISLSKTLAELYHIMGISTDPYKKIKESISITKNEELIEYASKLAGMNTIGIVSDISQIAYDILFTELNDFFSFCDKKILFFSNIFKMSKQHDKKNFFKRILNLLNVCPKDILVIDDDEANISIVSDLGINGILYQNHGSSHNWKQANKILFEELGA